MVACLLGLWFLYSSIREVRIPDASSKAQNELKADFKIPEDWKSASQSPVSNSQARWAFGPSGSQSEALFVIRSELSKDLSEDEVKGALEAGLRQTGGREWKRSEDKIDDKEAWKYRYSSKELEIATWFARDGETLWQFSCQFQSQKALERCAGIVDGAKLG
jgi:hypothetical protein